MKVIKNLFRYILSSVFPFLFSSKLGVADAKMREYVENLKAFTKSRTRKAKQDRYFYRNAGLNRQQRNHLHHEFARATGAKRELIKQILKNSPTNIPYVRGRQIPLQHVGTATPENLYLAA